MREGETLFDLLTRLGACNDRFLFSETSSTSQAYARARASHITWLVGALGTKEDRAWLRRYYNRHSIGPVGGGWWQADRKTRLASYYLVGTGLEYPAAHKDRVDDDIRNRFPYEYVLKLVQDG